MMYVKRRWDSYYLPLTRITGFVAGLPLPSLLPLTPAPTALMLDPSDLTRWPVTYVPGYEDSLNFAMRHFGAGKTGQEIMRGPKFGDGPAAGACVDLDGHEMRERMQFASAAGIQDTLLFAEREFFDGDAGGELMAALADYVACDVAVCQKECWVEATCPECCGVQTRSSLFAVDGTTVPLDGALVDVWKNCRAVVVGDGVQVKRLDGSVVAALRVESAVALRFNGDVELLDIDGRVVFSSLPFTAGRADMLTMLPDCRLVAFTMEEHSEAVWHLAAAGAGDPGHVIPPVWG